MGYARAPDPRHKYCGFAFRPAVALRKSLNPEGAEGPAPTGAVPRVLDASPQLQEFLSELRLRQVGPLQTDDDPRRRAEPPTRRRRGTPDPWR